MCVFCKNMGVSAGLSVRQPVNWIVNLLEESDPFEQTCAIMCACETSVSDLY